MGNVAATIVKTRKSKNDGEIVTDVNAYIDGLERETVILRALLYTLFEHNAPYIPQDKRDEWDDLINTDVTKAMEQVGALYDKATA